MIIAITFGLIGWLWLSLRQPETLPVAARRPLRVGTLWSGVREVLSDRQVILSTVTMSLGFGQMFAILSSAQQLYAAYGVTETFPYWFGAGAVLAATASFFNARFVIRLGMLRLARGGYLMQIGASAVMLVLVLSGLALGPQAMPVLFIWVVSVFFIAGITFGNINALAMQKMGHLAGMTASVLSAFSTIGAVLIAAPVGLAYDGTAMPVAVAALVCSALAWAIMGLMRG